MSWRKIIMGFGVGASALVAGCAVDREPAPPATVGPATQAVSCDKCRLTWVTYPIREGPKRHRMTRRIVGFGTRQSHECPDCRRGVAGFLATGTLAHTCAACGGSMERCESHPF